MNQTYSRESASLVSTSSFLSVLHKPLLSFFVIISFLIQELFLEVFNEWKEICMIIEMIAVFEKYLLQ